MPIIDAHTHCYPAEVYQNPRAWAEANHESHWADLVEPIGRKSIQAWATPIEMLRDMDAAGVEKAVLLGWYWEQFETCVWHNDVMAHWHREAPDRFIAFAAVQPATSPGQIIYELERAADLGLRGVGELHPGVQGFDSTSEGWLALADWCVAHDWPVNFHVTEAAGHDHPGSVATPLNDFIRMAKQHPELRLILSHWGGGLPFFEQNSKLRQALHNVYYDCAASPLLYDANVFRNCVNLVGIDKLLFGSDYPLRVFPRQQKSADFKRFIDYIQSETDFSAAELDQLFRGNFCKLLGL